MDQFSEKTFHARMFLTGEILVCHLDNEFRNGTTVLVGGLVLLEYNENKR
jgi:hypothetical protein